MVAIYVHCANNFEGCIGTSSLKGGVSLCFINGFILKEVSTCIASSQ